MSMNRLHLYFLIFLTVVFMPGCGPQVTGPGIRFASEQVDLGTVPEGKIFNFSYEYTNIGTETLVIGGVLSTCSCTHLDTVDQEVQPGQSGKITGRFDTARLEGKVSREVLVGTNVPDRENITLAIEATVETGPAAVSSIKVGGQGSGAALGHLQTGETAIGDSASPSKQITIAFSEAFSGIPKIIATVRNDPYWDGGDAFAVTVRSVTNKQFVVNIVRVDKALPWKQKPILEWMAWD
ncbi:MAG: DUF1573 domain-containing protein [Spirochaetales bacterium]|nr:DUF1573 domain-containing protein [Spirochaetales bacterium]